MLLLAMYTDGQPTENAELFCKCLEEASTDFRYGKTNLKGLRCAMFGLGNSVYASHYNTVRDLTKNVSYRYVSTMCGAATYTCNQFLCLSDIFMDIFCILYIPLLYTLEY